MAIPQTRCLRHACDIKTYRRLQAYVTKYAVRACAKAATDGAYTWADLVVDDVLYALTMALTDVDRSAGNRAMEDWGLVRPQPVVVHNGRVIEDEEV